MASLETQILAIPGAGRRTLLAALAQVPELPEGLCLCLLDAGRSDAPEQTITRSSSQNFPLPKSLRTGRAAPALTIGNRGTLVK